MAETAPRCELGEGREAAAPHTFDPEPVTRGQVKRSRMGRRRALVLIAVHIVVFVRILTWKLGDGEVVSPVEPSEAMYALADGVLNAGAVMLMVSLLSVLLLGRFFCGWACHLVALQDGAAWLLHKVGIRPKPLRSRWLVLIPLGAGLFMFGMPLFNRFFASAENPEPRGFFTEDLWETFPGFWVGLLTFLVCGFGMVYLLGAKGFCTYACPYGGLFGVVDRFSPYRIRVDEDACKACGHCTAVCTSNVEVAFEVHRFGAVVDPGCMKCLDCVSSCPENALSLGFGAPAITTRARREGGRDRRRYPAFAAELFAFTVFLLTLVLLVGLPRSVGELDLSWASTLHGVVPLLFALGLSATTGFIALGALRTLRGDETRFQRWTLRRGGRLTGTGKVFLGFSLAYGALLVLLGGFQAAMWRGDYHYLKLDVAQLAGRPEGSAMIPEAAADHAEALEAFARAERWRIFPDIRPAARLAGLYAADRDFEEAERWAERALEIDPEYAPSWSELAVIRRLRGDPEGERAALAEAVRLDPKDIDTLYARARLEERARDAEAWLAAERALLGALPEDDAPRRSVVLANIGRIEVALGRRDAGLEALREASRIGPENFAAWAFLASSLNQPAESEEAERAFRAALEIRPFDFGLRNAFRNFLAARGRNDEVRADVETTLQRLEEARAAAPEDARLALTLAAEYFAQKRFDDALVILEPLATRLPNDPYVADLLGRTRAARGAED